MNDAAGDGAASRKFALYFELVRAREHEDGTASWTPATLPVHGVDAWLRLTTLSLPVIYKMYTSQEMCSQGTIFWERAIGSVVRTRMPLL